MKPIDKPHDNNDWLKQSFHSENLHTHKVRLTPVSEEEREKYRVPSYGYIL